VEHAVSKPDSPTLQPTLCSHRDCNACAREFFRWRKTREAQMSMVMPEDAARGFTVTWAQAAATSVRP